MIIERLRDFEDELVSLELNDVIQIKKHYLSQQKTPDLIPDQLTDNLKAFYQQVTRFEWEWETKMINANGGAIRGFINILPANQVALDRGDQVYMISKEDEDYDDEDDLIRFKIVDLFFDNLCAGYVDYGDNKTELMQYLEMGEDSATTLGLNFNGYLEMMLAAKGWALWQRVIINIEFNKKYKSEAEEFKSYMPQLFPDFKWEEFVALYERVRIK